MITKRPVLILGLVMGAVVMLGAAGWWLYEASQITSSWPEEYGSGCCITYEKVVDENSEISSSTTTFIGQYFPEKGDYGTIHVLELDEPYVVTVECIKKTITDIELHGDLSILGGVFDKTDIYLEVQGSLKVPNQGSRYYSVGLYVDDITLLPHTKFSLPSESVPWRAEYIDESILVLNDFGMPIVSHEVDAYVFNECRKHRPWYVSMDVNFDDVDDIGLLSSCQYARIGEYFDFYVSQVAPDGTVEYVADPVLKTVGNPTVDETTQSITARNHENSGGYIREYYWRDNQYHLIGPYWIGALIPFPDTAPFQAEHYNDTYRTMTEWCGEWVCATHGTSTFQGEIKNEGVLHFSIDINDGYVGGISGTAELNPDGQFQYVKIYDSDNLEMVPELCELLIDFDQVAGTVTLTDNNGVCASRTAGPAASYEGKVFKVVAQATPVLSASEIERISSLGHIPDTHYLGSYETSATVWNPELDEYEKFTGGGHILATTTATTLQFEIQSVGSNYHTCMLSGEAIAMPEAQVLAYRYDDSLVGGSSDCQLELIVREGNLISLSDPDHSCLGYCGLSMSLHDTHFSLTESGR